MSNLAFAAAQIAEASAELRLAAWRDREVMLKRELENINKKRCALMALNRAGDSRGYKTYVTLSEATAELVAECEGRE